MASIAGLSAIAEGREAEPVSSPTLGAGMGAQQQQQLSPGEVQSAAPASALPDRVPQLKLDAGLHAQYRDTSEEGDNIRWGPGNSICAHSKCRLTALQLSNGTGQCGGLLRWYCFACPHRTIT